MPTSFSFFIKTTTLLLLLQGCARPVTPTGGKIDKTPPRIIQEKSTPNFQTNFKKQDIELTFDEYVVLKDLGKQVLISPPLGKAFNISRDITLKGKTVTVNFGEDVALRDSTTYTINFGTGIQDFNEGNPAKDMRFVFSTGAFLDSLSLRGQVVDAFSGAGTKAVTVMLYAEGTPDSLIAKGLPYYVAQTDEQGTYTFQNLSSGTYRVVAIEETFPNLKWDGTNERIGFLDEPIQLPDSTAKIPKIRLFSEQTAFGKTGQANPHFGYAWIAYNANPDSLVPPKATADVELLHEVAGDTVYVFYKNPPDSAWQLIVGADSLAIRPSSDSSYFMENPLDFRQKAATGARTTGRRSDRKATAKTVSIRPTPTKSLQATETAKLRFLRPLETVDSALCALSLDSLVLARPRLYIDSIDRRLLHIDFPWKGPNTYTFSLLPKAITDWYGQQNIDTLPLRLSIIDPEQLSTVEVELTAFVPEMDYWVELTKDGTKIDRSRAVKAVDSTLVFSFVDLPVAPYTIRIIEDKNANQRWDAGSFKQKQQAERIFSKKIESLKPNWSVNVSIELSENPTHNPKESLPKQTQPKKQE